MNGRRAPAPRGLVAFLAVVAAWGAMLALTWKRWSDPLVDLGRELAIPARLAAGERLYSDVRIHFGPLAYELPALLQRWLGTGVDPQLVGTLALSLVGLAALFRLASRRLEPAMAALATGLVAVVPFFFRFGSSMALPYSWGALFSAVAGWWALERAAGGDDASAGVLLGLGLAARIDATLPFVAAIGFGVLLERDGLRRKLPRFVAPLAAVAVAIHVPWAVRAGTGALARQLFRPLLDVPEAWQHLYASVAGFDRPAGNLLRIALALGAALLVLGAVAALLTRLPADRRWSGLAAAGVGCAAAALLLVVAGSFRDRHPWLVALSPLRPLPLLAFGASFVLAWQAIRLRLPGVDAAARTERLLAFAAAATSIRILLNARGNSPYGSFGLVLPTLLAAFLVLDRVPAFVERFSPLRIRLQSALAGVLLGCALAHAIELGTRLRRPGAWFHLTVPGGDLFVTPAVRGRTIAGTLDFLRASARPGDRLAAFPEAGALNVWTGLRSPLPWEQVLPDLLTSDEERELARRLESTLPEWVAWTNTDYSTWGAGRFGIDWGAPIAEVVGRRYERVANIGTPSDLAYAGIGPGLEITIFRRKE